MFGKPIIDHAEDMTMCADGYMNEGSVSYRLGVTGRPAAGEAIAVARDLILAKATGARLHVAHVSSKEALELIRRAKADGVPVTCEVTAQHLFFTDADIKNYDTAFKMAPPLRTEEDRLALIEGVTDGTIDAIVTDHAPHADEEKDVPFCCAPNGIAGLETSLSAVLTELYHKRNVSLAKICELMSTNPARLLGVEGGVLDVGAPADIVVVNPQKEWTVRGADLYTKALFTPFEGVTLRGKAVLTVVDGEIVMKEGRVCK